MKPGHIIFTGTCAGVIAGMKADPEKKPWLKAGDEVVIEIEGIGKLRNVMA
jgi:2-keto-4-pentenoate hydratase/2-oxohepta-3-ene-1,7-dioic acid hydratase in catechol pathway